MKRLKVATGLLASAAMMVCPMLAFADAGVNEGDCLNIENCEIQSVSKKFDSVEELDGLGSISIKQKLTDGQNSWYLLPTFDDREEALLVVKKETPSVLSLLSERYGIGEFSSSTWENYRSAIYKMYAEKDCPNWYVEGNEEISKLEAFFDIYENDEDNEEIEEAVNSARVSSFSKDEEDSMLEEEIFQMLPDQEVLLDAEDEHDELGDKARSSRGRADFSVSKGVAYAKKYADGKNVPKYAYFSWPFGGDCTNFASQILEAGGVKQVKNSSALKGWWHKSKNGAHSHSDSWIKARTFAKYMGVSYSTTSHKAFSKKLRKGDFIAFDKTGDGNYDHLGFVTATSTKTYKGANDYQVAQHGSDYLAWMSSDKNGWEKIENQHPKPGEKKPRYAIIRR